MTNYIGLNCPVCGKKFTADDDIVVCPQCGAPYHRDCYEKEGQCIFQDKHAAHEAWAPPRQEESQASAEEKKRCPRCGFENSGTALFCEHCGQPLSLNQQPENWAPPFGGTQQGGAPFGQQQGRPGGFPPPPPTGNYPPQGGFPGGPVPYPYDPMGGIRPSDEIDGVTVSDLAKFVQSNTQYYLPVFMNHKHFNRSRFNFCAFLFPGAWMLYRKLYKMGTIVTSAMFLIYIAYAYLFVNVLSPIYNTLMEKAGITADTLSPTTGQIQRMSDLISALPASQIFLLLLPVVVFIVQLAIMVVSGSTANRMYLRRCVSRVETIRKESERPADVAMRLQEEGGVNLPVAVCIGICYLILSYIPEIFF